MSLQIKVKEHGTEIEKNIEQLVYDSDVADKILLLEIEGPDVLYCFNEAVKTFPSEIDFANNVNYYRAFIPTEQFRARHPVKVEFYK